MTTPEDLAKAREISENALNEAYHDRPVHDYLVEHIAAALAEARTTPKPAAEVVEALEAPKGHVRTDDGVVRKVNGHLPINLSGHVVGVRAECWIVRKDRNSTTSHYSEQVYVKPTLVTREGEETSRDIHECWSTWDEAALAAQSAREKP